MLEKLLHWKPLLRLADLSKKIVFPGFEGVPIYNVMVFFIRGLMQSSLTMRAAAIAFTFILALFPGVLFFFTLIPYIPVKDFENTLFEAVRSFIPASATGMLEDMIHTIMKQPNSGLLSIGAILALYFSSNGMNALINAFNQTSHTIETRPFLIRRLVAFGLAVVEIIIFIISIGLIILSKIAVSYIDRLDINLDRWSLILLLAGKWLILLIMVFTAISIIYYFAPTKKRYFKFISAGSTLATIMTFLFVILFDFFIERFSSYNRLYGSIGTSIVVMVWVNFMAIFILIGYELNASIHEAKTDISEKNNNFAGLFKSKSRK